MKLTVNKEQIIEGLLKAAAILPAKAGTQYLRSIWLKAEDGRLEVMATDATLEFTGRYPAEVEEPGLVGVQGRAFAWRSAAPFSGCGFGQPAPGAGSAQLQAARERGGMVSECFCLSGRKRRGLVRGFSAGRVGQGFFLH